MATQQLVREKSICVPAEQVKRELHHALRGCGSDATGELLANRTDCRGGGHCQLIQPGLHLPGQADILGRRLHVTQWTCCALTAPSPWNGSSWEAGWYCPTWHGSS